MLSATIRQCISGGRFSMSSNLGTTMFCSTLPILVSGVATRTLMRGRFANCPVAASIFRFAKYCPVAFSFSRCFCLYGERIGVLHSVGGTTESAKAVETQICEFVSQLWGQPPLNDTLIVVEVLSNDDLREEWLAELGEVTGRLIQIRRKLADLLEEKTGRGWDFVISGGGMFMLTGLSVQHVELLRSDEGVFIPANGRLSVPSVNNGNVKIIAQAIANVVNAK